MGGGLLLLLWKNGNDRYFPNRFHPIVIFFFPIFFFFEEKRVFSAPFFRSNFHSSFDIMDDHDTPNFQ
jgi:hypothetical protein